MHEPVRKPSRLRQLLDNPEARPRVRKAVVSLLSVVVASIGVIGVLLIWHLVRRGRLIREGLAPPKDVRLPDISERAKPGDAPP